MLALSRQLQQLRSTRKQTATKIEALRRQINFENRPNSQYTASGLKRNRDEKDDEKTRRAAFRPDDLPDVSEPVIKKPKISSIVAQVQPEQPASAVDGSEPGLDGPSPSGADAEMTESGAGDVQGQATAPKKRSRQADLIRNKRMFGALLGHLNKAKENITEEKQAEKMQRRATLEQHVQERIQNDTAQIREEKLKQLQEEMELEQKNLSETMEKLVQTENKMKAARLVERHIRNAGLIQTVAQPFILWKPRLHTSRTKNMLLRSRKKTKEVLREAIAKWGFSSVEEFEVMLKEKKPIVNVTNPSTKKRVKDDGDEAGEDQSSNEEEDPRDKENDGVGEQQPDPSLAVQQPESAENPSNGNMDEVVPVEDEANKEGVVVVVGEVDADLVNDADPIEAES